MSTPDQTPPPTDTTPQPFALQFNVEGGIKGDPEELRKVIHKALGQFVLAQDGVELFSMASRQVSSGEDDKEQNTTETSVDEPSIETPAMPEALPLMAIAVQEELGTPIRGIFTQESDLESLDEAEEGVTPNNYTAPASGATEANSTKDHTPEKIVPVSVDRQREFADAAAAHGIRTVRDATILGLDALKKAVGDTKPYKLLKLPQFRQDVKTFINDARDAIPEEVYKYLLGDSKDRATVERPASLEQIAAFCGTVGDIPARAIQTTHQNLNELGSFPDAWATHTVAWLIDPRHKQQLIEKAILDPLNGVSEEQAVKCLEEAQAFTDEFNRLKHGQ